MTQHSQLLESVIEKSSNILSVRPNDLIMMTALVAIFSSMPFMLMQFLNTIFLLKVCKVRLCDFYRSRADESEPALLADSWLSDDLRLTMLTGLILDHHST